MFIEPKNESSVDQFYWVATRFILFELERFGKASITQLHGSKLVENLIKFHEKNESYEVCTKIILYKSIMKDV